MGGPLAGTVAALFGTASAGAASPVKNACAAEIVLAGAAQRVAAIDTLVRELLERDGIAVVATQTKSIEPETILSSHGGAACAYIWIDLRRRDEARLYLANTNGQRIVVRHLPLPDGLDELGRESIGQIVESSALALATGADIGMPREEAARIMTAASDEPIPPALADERPARTWSAVPSPYRVKLGYGAEALFAGPGMQHGPELGFELAWGRGSTRIVLGVNARYNVPVSVSTSQVELLIDGASFRVEGGPEFWVGAHTWIDVVGGAGVDMIRLQPQRTFDPTLTPASTDLFTGGAARATLVVGRRISPSVELAASAFADFSWADTHFDVRQNGTTSPTLTLWSVRPGLAVALSVVLDPTR